MTTHGHKHTHASKTDKHPRHQIDWTGLHKDWRTWLVIGLMLAAMATYVLTLDDSIQPGGAARDKIPAAAPASPSK